MNNLIINTRGRKSHDTVPIKESVEGRFVKTFSRLKRNFLIIRVLAQNQIKQHRSDENTAVKVQKVTVCILNYEQNKKIAKHQNYQ